MLTHSLKSSPNRLSMIETASLQSFKQILIKIQYNTGTQHSRTASALGQMQISITWIIKCETPTSLIKNLFLKYCQYLTEKPFPISNQSARLAAIGQATWLARCHFSLAHFAAQGHFCCGQHVRLHAILVFCTLKPTKLKAWQGIVFVSQIL